MRNRPLKVREIAELVGGKVDGDESVQIEGIASVHAAGPMELTFAADEKHMARLLASGAGAAVVGPSCPPAPMSLVRVENVKAAMARLLGHLSGPEDLPPAGVHGSAVVAPDAEVAPGAAVAAGVTIGPRAKVGGGSVLCARVSIGADVELGRDVVLYEGVVVRADCKIGDRVRIGPNSVIGFEGFGYYTADGVHHRIPHIGNVVIEQDVSIGACSCVDRAKFGSTRIGAGTKVDNLVQIAHNVQIGRGCILVGQCGVAGSAELGQYVVVGGAAGIRDNIAIGDGAQIAAFSAVAGEVADGQAVVGVPAGPAKEQMRIIMAARKLPELLKRVKKLEARLNAIESSEHH